MAAVKSEVVTFFRAFPDGAVWGNTYSGEGYGVVLAAKNGGIRVDVDRSAAEVRLCEIRGRLA